MKNCERILVYVYLAAFDDDLTYHKREIRFLSMDLISLLSEILGDYKPFSNGEIYFACPFCHHHSKKLAVNISKKMWHCWICNVRGKSLLSLFKKLDATTHQLHRLKSLVSEQDIRDYKSDVAEVQLRLPPEYHPLWVPKQTHAYKNALTYLKQRNITGIDIIRYGIGYCESGEYANRIIVPSYNSKHELNYFISRAIYDTKYKYKNPRVSKNIIAFENQINWKLSPIVLCEGIFDAMAIRVNAIPLLGKSLSSAVLSGLIQHRVPLVYVVLDSDATTAAMDIELKLTQYGIQTKRIVLDGKDPSEAGFVKTWHDIDTSATTTDFKEYIQQKLSESL
jgi:DNA primase